MKTNKKKTKGAQRIRGPKQIASLLLVVFTTHLCFPAHTHTLTHTLPQTLMYVPPVGQSQMNLLKMRSREAAAEEADSSLCRLLIISSPLFISSSHFSLSVYC